MPDIHICIEPTLLEHVVFTATRAAPQIADEYQQAFAGCYCEPAGERREQLFAELHQNWFDRLGFRQRIMDRIGLFPFILARVARVVIADARQKRQSSVELFGKPEYYAMVIAVTPALLIDTAVFDYWARFELMHVDDMLDPTFGYDLSQSRTHASLPAEKRALDSFALLWSISIDARLAHLPTAPSELRDRRLAEMERAFGTDQTGCRALMEKLWPATGTPVRPVYAKVLEWSRLSAVDEKNGNESALSRCRSAVPGAKCPLCHFPTFDWASLNTMDENTRMTIRNENPHWDEAELICGRCAELYRSRHASRRIPQAASCI